MRKGTAKKLSSPRNTHKHQELLHSSFEVRRSTFDVRRSTSTTSHSLGLTFHVPHLTSHGASPPINHQPINQTPPTKAFPLRDLSALIEASGALFSISHFCFLLYPSPPPITPSTPTAHPQASAPQYQSQGQPSHASRLQEQPYAPSQTGG